MLAAVYRGPQQVHLEEIPLPSIGPKEILLQVEACGICPTDLKKIVHGDLPPPKVFGHEVAGRISAIGNQITQWRPGDRAVFFHHIPCRTCDDCQRGAYAQCPQYKRVGTTAGFEPAGGGFAEFVKISDWIVGQGLVKIPEGIDAEEATFVEPVNTCLKAIQKAGPLNGRSVLIFGAGPVGLLLAQIARLEGGIVYATDLIPERLAIAKKLGVQETFLANQEKAADWGKRHIDPRGVDVALVATASSAVIEAALEAVRPAGRVVLFAQTRVEEFASLDVGQIGKLEKELVGSYSASIDLQEKAAELVFHRAIQVKPLITHRFSLHQVEEALRIALQPSAQSLKVVLLNQQKTVGTGSKPVPINTESSL